MCAVYIRYFKTKHSYWKEWGLGNSIFKENTEVYEGDNLEEVKTKLTTVDTICKGKGPFQLMKVDLQGAELMALKGAQNTLKHVEIIFTEISVVAYNDGSPLWYETQTVLESLGFMAYDITELHYREDLLFQVDILWVKKTGKWVQKNITGLPAPKPSKTTYLFKEALKMIHQNLASVPDEQPTG